MPEIPMIIASHVSKFKAAKLAVDGETVAVWLEQPDGKEQVIAFPASQLRPLIELCAGALQVVEQAKSPGYRLPFRATGFELWGDAQTSLNVLSLRLSPTIRLSFAFDNPLGLQLLETLQARLGISTAPPPGSPKH